MREKNHTHSAPADFFEDYEVVANDDAGGNAGRWRGCYLATLAALHVYSAIGIFYRHYRLAEWTLKIHKTFQAKNMSDNILLF